MLRSEVVAELVKEVLGPRNGPREVIESNPMDEYITGVLQPAGARPPLSDVESVAEHITGEDVTNEEEFEESEFSSFVFSSALDPRVRPSSVGLSFYVKVADSQAEPTCDVCVTWARYLGENAPNQGKAEAGGHQGKQRWRRHPRVWVDELHQGVLYLNERGATVSEQAEVSVHMTIDREPDEPDIFRIRIHLVNRLQVADPDRISAEDCVFQPQIRVCCGDGTSLEPVRVNKRGSDPEDARLDFLYRDRPVMARGYLAAATWKQIDPERPLDAIEAPAAPPFLWVDGEALDNPTRHRFSPADVRTEFVPLYATLAPEWDWDRRYGPEPEVNAKTLSEIAANPGQLRQRLEPLLNGYRTWLEERNTEVLQLSDPEASIARSLLKECQEVLRRMAAGLKLLTDDPDARLSFAFANRAMWIQASWLGRTMRWRPFQLAFILMNLEAIANPDSPDRTVCDLLWVPTGGGKTEAYLALAAFTLALRRRRALRRQTGDRTGLGMSVLSRYTLRLLTIQQFRRALAMVTACEMLRVEGLAGGGPVGWRPPNWPDRQDFLWGSGRFSIGLWVGGNLTPNRLDTVWVKDVSGKSRPLNGALDILRGQRGEGEPAQVLECPACRSILAVPEEESGLTPGDHVLHLTLSAPQVPNPPRYIDGVMDRFKSGPGFSLDSWKANMLPSSSYLLLSVSLHVQTIVTAASLDHWWNEGPGQYLSLACFRASRPGYFPITKPGQTRSSEPRNVDFEIWCPSPDCPLAEKWWCEGAPTDVPSSSTARKGRSPVRTYVIVRHPDSGLELRPQDGLHLRRVKEIWGIARPVSRTDAACFLAGRIPIPAVTVDDQLYRRPPTMVVATVDKFARLPFEPRAGALFGNVTFYDPWKGYSRDRTGALPVPPLDPPDLILQDELHLIEGPLGSLTGLYEVAIDELCRNGSIPVKYIASTATIREAAKQVQALFSRRLQVFPPPGFAAGDRFFLRTHGEPHPLEAESPGQLYVGICAPGRGPLTPVVRIWTCLLQQVYRRRRYPDADYFWTLTGYFNAIRELAGARALYRQDIPERLVKWFSSDARPLSDDRVQELSSLSASTSLPAVLGYLQRRMPDASDALFATSMFGTGIDIARLSLMVIHGQPKTCSAYIQAAGRVGRTRGALVVTLLRASRPRDLSHYEFFCGYHRQLHRYVEPVTVMPFSPGAVDLACGPVMVALLRNRRNTSYPWHDDQTAPNMASSCHLSEVQTLSAIMEARARSQPSGRQPPPGEVERITQSKLARWSRYGQLYPNLCYVEYPVHGTLVSPVVLGDPEHEHAGLPVVFENVFQSLREIEETIGLEC